MKNKRQIKALLYATPAVAIFLFIIVVPMLQSIYFSMTDWSGTSSEISFVGLINYRRIFSDKTFLVSVRNTVILTVTITAFQNVLGILLAICLNRKWLSRRNFYRSVLFIPSLISAMVTGYMWKYILSPYDGLLGMVLDAMNITNSAAFNVFSKPNAAFITVMATMIWQNVGYDMVIYLSGLQAIPDELYESCSIDGANPTQKLFHVTLPMLMPSVTIAVFLNLIGSLKCFEQVYVLTGGGPAHSTETIATYIYNTAFSGGQVAYGTAASTILFFSIFIVAIVQVKFFRSKEVEL